MPADVCVDLDAGAERGPGVAVVVFAPGDPGRCPLIAGQPHPAVIVVEMPAAVMEGGPAPAVVGGPGPAIVGIDPLSAGVVRTEIFGLVGTGDPGIAEFGRADPVAVRGKFAVEGEEGDVPVPCVVPVCVGADCPGQDQGEDEDDLFYGSRF